MVKELRYDLFLFSYCNKYINYSIYYNSFDRDSITYFTKDISFKFLIIIIYFIIN